MCHSLSGYSIVSVFGKVRCTVCNLHAIFQMFCIISVRTSMVSITAFKAKLKHHKS